MLSGGDFGKRTVRAVPYVGIQASGLQLNQSIVSKWLEIRKTQWELGVEGKISKVGGCGPAGWPCDYVPSLLLRGCN